MYRWTTVAAACLGTLALTAALAVPAGARGGDAERRGNCSGAADWRLKAEPYNGRIDIEGRVEGGRANQRWTWQIRHDGYVSSHGKARADGGGSFKIERQVVDASGSDHIGWRATNTRTGQKCRGGVTI